MITTVDCQTDWKLNTLQYSKSFKVDTTVKAILEDMLKSANLPSTSNISALADDKLSSPLIFADTVEATLDKLAHMFHFSWSMQDYGFLAVSVSLFSIPKKSIH